MRYRRVMTRYVRLVPIRESLPYFDVLRSLTPVVPIAPLRWRPPADVCETAGSIVIVLDVAGLDEDAIDVEVYQDAVVVEGERRIDSCGPDGSYLAAEIRQGRFHVEVALPTLVDADRVQATYERGLLRVELTKAVVRTREGTVAPARDGRADNGANDASVGRAR
jgi:HSP20 family protein